MEPLRDRQRDGGIVLSPYDEGWYHHGWYLRDNAIHVSRKNVLCTLNKCMVRARQVEVPSISLDPLIGDFGAVKEEAFEGIAGAKCGRHAENDVV